VVYIQKCKNPWACQYKGTVYRENTTQACEVLGILEIFAKRILVVLCEQSSVKVTVCGMADAE